LNPRLSACEAAALPSLLQQVDPQASFVYSFLQDVRVNSIQHNDYIVILRATKAFKSPLLRSRNDRC
jgi:hypothetical protein